MPEGFVQSQADKTSNSLSIVYSYDKKCIMFDQYTQSAFKLNIDNEHNLSDYYTDTDGTVYEISTSKDNTIIIWSNEDYAFMITSNLNKDEVLKLCRSTKLKD